MKKNTLRHSLLLLLTAAICGDLPLLHRVWEWTMCSLLPLLLPAH